MRGARREEGTENLDPNTVVWDDVSNLEELEKAVADVLEGTRPDAEVECKIGGQWNKVSACELVANHDTNVYRSASYQRLPK